jgi:predicted glycogen debranching enzyme
MTDPVRTVALDDGDPESKEYLVANGLGGYSSATVLGTVTRRYHGVLVAALPAPFGRTVMLSRVDASLDCPDGSIIELQGREGLAEFRLELGLPVWVYRNGEITLEKRVLMRHRQNTTDLVYTLQGGSARLKLRPWISFRSSGAEVQTVPGEPLTVSARQDLYEIFPGDERPPLRLHLAGAEARFELTGGSLTGADYVAEERAGYPWQGTLWSPGAFRVPMKPGAEVSLVASTEPWHAVLALAAKEALGYEEQRRRRLISIAHPLLRQGAEAELVLAADSFVFKPDSRVADAARAEAMGDETRSVIAGYHWFTDWGRDTMIALEGLTLPTGRAAEAGWILRTFAHYTRDGLIPNMFPEGRSQGLYHTADASLWFFHALNRYLGATGDRATLQLVLPKLREIVDCHLGGTRFGIGVDPADGLLKQGEAGYQLTWMDAKVGDWVVTPRRGKAVEVNALWYNALRLMEGWLAEAEETDEASRVRAAADRALASFNRRFWSDRLGHLIDVVDGENGDDPACRPNQLLAISLDHPVLEPARWEAVVETVRNRLLTPFGLRSLAPGHPDYKEKYYGDIRARDAAYHQGTVWAWLIGPYVDAWLKLHPHDRAGARQLLEGLLPNLSQHGIGSLSEIFDAEPPFTPRGAISQAWSVAEFLRCFVKTAGDAEHAAGS